MTAKKTTRRVAQTIGNATTRGKKKAASALKTQSRQNNLLVDKPKKKTTTASKVVKRKTQTIWTWVNIYNDASLGSAHGSKQSMLEARNDSICVGFIKVGVVDERKIVVKVHQGK